MLSEEMRFKLFLKGVVVFPRVGNVELLAEGCPTCTQHKAKVPPSMFTNPACFLCASHLPGSHAFLPLFPSLPPLAHFYYWPAFSSSYFLLILSLF